MLTLGIICYQGHSSSAALVRDGVIVEAVSEERFTRKKHDDSFPQNAIGHILESQNIDINDISEIGIAWSIKQTIIGQFKRITKLNWSFVFENRNGYSSNSRIEKFLKINGIKKELRSKFNYQGRVQYYDHHLCHALSSFYSSGFDESIVFVADGMGESSSTSIYNINQNKIDKIYADEFPHSIGVFYSAGTQFLNYLPDSDEFKIMGMSAYGQPSELINLFEKLYKVENGHFKLNIKYFEIHKKSNSFISEDYKNLFGSILSTEQKKNFAYALQFHLEKIVLSLIQENQLDKISKNFCSAGGVFLNCLLNQKIRKANFFNNLYFFPTPDDDGTSVGAALLGQIKNRNFEKLTNLYLGPEIKFDPSKLNNKFKARKIESLSEVAQLLADGKVIAWAQGKMEFGHRALGNRSILADPRDFKMKEKINEKIKYREEYRPFAPSVLEERASTFFNIDSDVNYNFMIETVAATEIAKKQVPAIVHVDNTSRIQTVEKDRNNKYWSLINEFYKLTKIPMLLNTSLNLNGMPIVSSFQDSLVCFENSDLDFLVVEEWIIWKNN